MPIVTATQVTVFTDISQSAGTITTNGFIPIVQDRITDYCYNWFVNDDIDLQGSLVFNATAATIVSQNSFETEGFAAGDEFFVYNSLRNDGYYTIDSISAETITIASTETVVSEISGQSILVSLVQWPNSIAYVAAQFVKYDTDDRGKRVAGLTAQSLGPRSESYGTDFGAFGYPSDLLSLLDQFKIMRLM